MKLPISARLLACCNYVNQGDRVADIGCDHGYLGIHLLTSGTARFVIASDVNEQPLQSALHNAVKYGVKDRMAFYLSDGVSRIPRDFDCLVCAGMGADTIVSILEAAPWLRCGSYRLVLQCQSRRAYLRQYLSGQGWHIRRETLAQDGKFIYPVMEAVWEPGHILTAAQCHISPALRQSGSSLLPAYYERVLDGLRATVAGLSHSAEHEKLTEYRRILEELESLSIT